MPARPLVLAAALALALTGCAPGGGDVSAPAPPAVTAARSSAPVGALTAEALDDAMVAVPDMPTGWSRDTSMEEPPGDGPTESPAPRGTEGAEEESGAPCGIDELMGYEPRGVAYRYFVKGSGASAMSMDVDAVALQDVAAAQTVFTQLRSNLITCPAWEDDEMGEGAVSEMSAPTLGDESGAVSVRFEDEESGPYAIEVRYVRVGSVVVTSIGDGASGTPTADQAKALEAQVGRLRAALAKAGPAAGRDL